MNRPAKGEYEIIRGNEVLNLNLFVQNLPIEYIRAMITGRIYTDGTSKTAQHNKLLASTYLDNRQLSKEPTNASRMVSLVPFRR